MMFKLILSPSTFNENFTLLLTDIVMMLHIPEKVNTLVVITLSITWHYPLENNDLI